MGTLTDDEAEQKATERWQKFKENPAAEWFQEHYPALYQTIADAEFMNGDSGEVLIDLGSFIDEVERKTPGTLLLSDAIKKQKQEY